MTTAARTKRTQDLQLHEKKIIGATVAKSMVVAKDNSTAVQRGSLRESGVPEVHARRRTEVAAQLAARDVQREVVAELHRPDVLVVDRLDAIDDRLALLDVRLLPEIAEQTLLLLVAPPAVERAAHRHVERGIRGEHEAGGRHVPAFGLLRPVVQRRPVDDLKVDDDAHLLELLL